MAGFSKAEFIKGPVKRLAQLLFVRNDGSIDVNLLGLGNVKSTAIVFATGVAVKLPEVSLVGRQSLILRPIISSAGTFYVGGEDVTVENGLPLENSDYFSIDINESADLWGVADVSGEVRILEITEA